ncbi:MAG: hypothetical protein Q9191_000525 [Dirinaria sp. TL-2023a]
MASQQGRSERVYHQDYIARIRYENGLPPPPGAPKLLDIPMEGLSYYTSAAFASRMARQQPLNIEADAELGMPIDLVGMPGIFDGDESAIQAPLSIPPAHPKDKPLLRPLSELGKPKYATSGHSFLRRTEYISTESSRSRDSFTPRNLSKASQRTRRQVDTAKDDPVNILRATVKGFDIAFPEDAYKGPDAQNNKIRGAPPTHAEVEAWNNPQHPTNPELKLVDAYPIMPDLDAIPEIGGYHIIKFTANPTAPSVSRDVRLDVGFLEIKEPSIEAQEALTEEFNAKMAAHNADPTRNPVPGPQFNYELFLPRDEQVAKGTKRKLDIDDPDKDSDELYGSEQRENPGFRYDHIRAYDTARSVSNEDYPYKEVVLALHDNPALENRIGTANGKVPSEDLRLEKAAYYYPIYAKLQLKPRRIKNLAQIGRVRRAEEEDAHVDAMHVTIKEPSGDEQEDRNARLLALDGGLDPEQ